MPFAFAAKAANLIVKALFRAAATDLRRERLRRGNDFLGNNWSIAVFDPKTPETPFNFCPQK